MPRLEESMSMVVYNLSGKSKYGTWIIVYVRVVQCDPCESVVHTKCDVGLKRPRAIHCYPDGLV